MKTNEEYIYAGLLVFGNSLLVILWGFAVDYSAAQLWCYGILGCLLMLVGILGLRKMRNQRKRDLMDFSTDYPDYSDGSPLAVKLAAFREHFGIFFEKPGIEENSAIQSDTTQIFKSVLDQQKRRLDRLGIRMQFRSMCKKFTPLPIREQSRSDGKYQIHEVMEEIEAKRRFTRNGREIFLRSNEQAAHYTVITALQRGEDTVICPNCGNETTRENLIDGCDYCGTKFTVEDLGDKISKFSLQDDYGIAYAKYKKSRWKSITGVMVLSFVLIFLFINFCVLLLTVGEPSDGDPTNPLILALGLGSVGGIISGMLACPVVLLYLMVIFPLREISASFKYRSKKKLAALKTREAFNHQVAEQVRAFDPLFSESNFVSSLQNRLSQVLFGDDPQYQRVMDYDIECLTLEGFTVAQGLQQLRVSLKLRLFELNPKLTKVKSRYPSVQLLMVKDETCKTQAICEPSVMVCPNCGSSLSVAEGLVCENCGTRLDLKKYDWVIAEMR